MYQVLGYKIGVNANSVNEDVRYSNYLKTVTNYNANTTAWTGFHGIFITYRGDLSTPSCLAYLFANGLSNYIETDIASCAFNVFDYAPF